MSGTRLSARLVSRAGGAWSTWDRAGKLRTALAEIGGGFRLVFVVDASPDGSWDVVRQLAAEDSRVCGLRLERQVGQHAAVLAGLALVHARWYVVMDADLQDRPE